ncbi:MAG TPA: hypothetical protein VG269_11970 [Tepidisphaeraceae bacterium]|jgi:hypothetical protein|nr:hypothetical protein [Tepidisphaeraceae bacterium]
MLEILILWQLCKNVGVKLRAKGRKPGGYQFMLIAMWFGGEIIGGIIGAIALDGGLGAYLLAILGAVAGVVGAFVIVNSVAPVGVDRPTGGFPVTPLPAADPLEQRPS